MRTGFPIVYTSADSVFQIAAHEEVIPVETLYEFCREARRLLDGPWRVGRVIARPFTGHSGAYVRTKRRKDFSVQPPGNTMLDVLQKAGLETMGIGKIEDIFAQRGLSRIEHTTDNASGIQATLRAMQQPFQGLVFTNLVDFDMLYGHRNDVKGYGEALTVFDNALPELIAALGPEDLLIVTADHGCDPATPSTDHSREYIPILAMGPAAKAGVNIGVRDTFADIAATILTFFGMDNPLQGTSFYQQIVGEAL